MKLLKSLIIVASIAVFAACKKNNTTIPTVVMSADVASSSWVSYQSRVTISKTPTLHVTIAADSATTHMQLDLGNYSGPGTYSLYDSANSARYTAFYSGVGNVTHVATSGQIVVTDNVLTSTGATEIKGTFKFLGDTLSVKNGAFDVMLYLN